MVTKKFSVRETVFSREPVFRKLGASFQKLAPYFFENQPVLKIREPVLKNWPFEKMETLGKCIFCHAIFSVMQRLRLKKSLVVYRNLRLKKSLVVYGILALQYFHQRVIDIEKNKQHKKTGAKVRTQMQQFSQSKQLKPD